LVYPEKMFEYLGEKMVYPEKFFGMSGKIFWDQQTFRSFLCPCL
jgi:hypothetical protein